MKTLVVITGPTGVGKTELCLEIATKFGSPIINSDSRQLFRELPIGTAAPTAEQMLMVRHYFVGTLSVTNYYSASMYEHDALALINKLFKTHDVLILTGGSMMYIDAVCNGIDDIPTVDHDTRTAVKLRYEREGLVPIIADLAKLDPEYYDIVDRKNPKRVIHALEICLSTGRTYTSFRQNIKKTRPFNIIKIGITRNRDELYTRIDQRVDKMIDEGLPNEALNVIKHRDLNALNTVGYKEIFSYLDGLYTLEEAARRIKFNTHKYCRKQLTWFKRDPQMRWFESPKPEEIIEYIKDKIQKDDGYQC